MTRSVSLALSFVLLLGSTSSAFAWGARGHSVIDHTAIETLPNDSPVFLKAALNAAFCSTHI